MNNKVQANLAMKSLCIMLPPNMPTVKFKILPVNSLAYLFSIRHHLHSAKAKTFTLAFHFASNKNLLLFYGSKNVLVVQEKN